MQFYHSKKLNSVSNVMYAFTSQDNGNLAFHVNDNPKSVQINHNKLSKELDYEKRTLVHMKQIHSDIVHIVNEHDNFENPPTCDALITNKKNTPIMVMVADCSPILFYDEKQDVIAVAHAGRSGAFKNIVKNVIDTFTAEFQSDPKDIVVTVGASIGICCYEVGSEINEEAKELNLQYAMQKKEKSFYLDVSKILHSQLLSAGIKKENIEISNECTSCKSDKYFSYRASGITGRFAGIIMLK
jgi:hypothetical protein